ncbi:MAG TPA: hypothetical protein VMY35_07630 [Phycisphaerae bacterium]|nr:hypothetical protein [Phycisphaerae bacterium]
MKRILLAVFLLLAFAVPAWGGATNDVDVYWTGEDYAADGNTYDFQNPTGNNWRLVSDDSPLGAGNFPGATGCTLNFLDSALLVVGGLPGTNLPNAGESFILVIRDDGEPGWDTNLLDFCGVGNWSYSALTIGGPLEHNSIVSITKDSAVGGTITVWAGPIIKVDLANASITAESGSFLFAVYGIDVALTQKLTTKIGSCLLVDLGTLTLNGGCDLAGTLRLLDGAIIDAVSPIVVTADGVEVDWDYDHWAGGPGTLYGGFNAAGFSVTHTNTTGATLTCDQAGDLELGGDATGLAVTISAAVDLDGDMDIYSLAMGANVTCAAARATTVGAGGFEMTAGILTGELDVDLSAAAGAGAYTQTDGTIAADAVLNVTTGTGGFTYAAGTLTGNIDITTGAATTTAVWDTTTNKFRTLTINASITPSGKIRCKALAGAAAIVTDTNKDIRLYPIANDFWTYTGTLSGAGGATIGLPASRSNSDAIELSNSPLIVFTEITSGTTTLTAGTVSTGTGALSVYAAAGANPVTVAGLSTSALTCSTVALGNPSLTNQGGSLTLRPGVHVVTSTIARGAVATTNNVFNPQGRVILGGTMTGTGIVVTPTYEGEIDCGGTARVTAVTSTGRRLVVRRAVDAAGAPVRSWNGDSCTNVRFLGRKKIGAPGVN